MAQSNYNKQMQSARAIFLTCDQGEMIRRYGLAHDGAYLYLTFIGDGFRISRTDGGVEVSDGAGGFVPCGDFNTVMTLYDVLGHPAGTPRLAGAWCPLHGLQVTMSSPSDGTFTQRYADAFAGHADRLAGACRALGGTALEIAAGADAAVRLDLFPFFPVQFRFWDADDEFPAKIQLLWDRNALQFMHFETLYYAMGALLEKLLAAFRAAGGAEHTAEEGAGR